MLNGAMIFMMATLTISQAGTRARDTDFQKLRGLLGTWEATDIEVGDGTVDAVCTWKMVLDRRFIEHAYIITGDNGQVDYGLVMFGRDPADGKVHGWGWDSRGGLMSMELVGWEGKQGKWSTKFIDPEGTVVSANANGFEVLEKDSYRWMLDSPINGKSEAVFNRVKPKKMKFPEQVFEATGDQPQALQDLAWLVGHFEYKGVDAFTEIPNLGFVKSGYTLNERFLQYDAVSVDAELEVSLYRAVLGIDPTTGKTTGWEFESSGTVGKYVMTDKGHLLKGQATSPNMGKLEYEGKITDTEDGFSYSATGDDVEENKTIFSGVWKRRQKQN